MFIHRSSRSFSWMWKTFRLEKAAWSFIKVPFWSLWKIWPEFIDRTDIAHLSTWTCYRPSHHCMWFKHGLKYLSPWASRITCPVTMAWKFGKLFFVHGARIEARNFIFSPHSQSGPLYLDKGTKCPISNADGTGGKATGAGGRRHGATETANWNRN